MYIYITTFKKDGGAFLKPFHHILHPKEVISPFHHGTLFWPLKTLEFFFWEGNISGRGGGGILGRVIFLNRVLFIIYIYIKLGSYFLLQNLCTEERELSLRETHTHQWKWGIPNALLPLLPICVLITQDYRTGLFLQQSRG